MTAARSMAAADSPSAALRRDLCTRGIRLAGKMRADVLDLLDAYVSLPRSSRLPRGWEHWWDPGSRAGVRGL